MADDFTERYGDLLTGSYELVDRIVLNAYYPLGHSPGGFRTWWRRWHGDSDAELDDAHLMRLPGRFARRVRAWAKTNGVPVIECKAGQRKHRIAEEYLASHSVGPGVFLVLVARARATVWKVRRSPGGVIMGLEKKSESSTTIPSTSWTRPGPPGGEDVRAPAVRRAGHPERPRVRRVPGSGGWDRLCQGGELLYLDHGSARPGPDRRDLVAGCGYRAAGPGLRPVDLHRVLLLLAGPGRPAGQRVPVRLLGLPGRVQPEPDLRLRRAVDRVFGTVADRTRSRLDVPALRTLFGIKKRPAGTAEPSLKLAVVIERPAYDLTLFKVHFGLLTLKGYTKGERVLRFEAIVHNTKTLKTGRALEKFPDIIARLASMAGQFCTMLDSSIPGSSRVACSTSFRCPPRSAPPGPAAWT